MNWLDMIVRLILQNEDEANKALFCAPAFSLCNISHDVMERRKYRIKVPKGIRARNNDIPSSVTFKNLTNNSVSLYWIDFSGVANFFAELAPINRSHKGFPVKTFASHPWVAIQGGKRQMLLNGKRYFFPPNPASWEKSELGPLKNKWILSNPNATYGSNGGEEEAEQYFEVLIGETGHNSLQDICLLRCCEIYKTENAIDQLGIAANLMMKLRMTRRKFFHVR